MLLYVLRISVVGQIGGEVVARLGTLNLGGFKQSVKGGIKKRQGRDNTTDGAACCAACVWLASVLLYIGLRA
jgi:hypothetical protein